MRSSSKFHILIRTLVAGSLLAVAACAPTQGEHQDRMRFLWPASVEDARIEYIGPYRSTADIEGGKNSAMAEVIFGKLPPRFVFEKPQAVAASASGKVFVTDTIIHKVHVMDLKQNSHGFLQDSEGDDVNFSLPMGLAVDDQYAYVVDTNSLQVYVFSFAGQLVNAFVLEGLDRPTQIAVDPNRDRVYVVDTAGHRVVVYNKSFEQLFVIGARGNSPGLFNYPLDADVDADGNLYVLDSMNARVQVFDTDGQFLREFGERGTADGSFRMAKSLAVSPSGHVYVTDGLAHRFVVFDIQGQYLLTLGGRSQRTDGQITPGGFYLPHGIDVDENESIWVVDSLNRTLHKFQYLNDAYLAEHPISSKDVYRPED